MVGSYLKNFGSAAILVTMSGCLTVTAPTPETPTLPTATPTQSDQPSDSAPDPTKSATGNHPPVAEASYEVVRANAVELNSFQSHDQDNDPLIPVWRLASAPHGSTFEGLGGSSIVGSKVNLQLDKAGDYAFDLFVFDGIAWSVPNRISFFIAADAPATPPTAPPNPTAATPPPVVVPPLPVPPPFNDTTLTPVDISIDTPIAGQLGIEMVVRLNANGLPSTATYKWQVVIRPDGSKAEFVDDRAESPKFTPDVDGEYLVNVDVNLGTSQPKRTYHLKLRVTNYDTLKLDFNPTSVKFSEALNTLVMLDADKSELHLFNMETRAFASIALPLLGQLVDVSADGMHAVVSHDAYITYIDLKDKKIEKSMSIPAKLSGLALLNNGTAIGIPSRDQWSSMLTVNFNTSSFTTKGWLIYAGSVLAQQNDTVYYMTSGLSPTDISRVTLDASGQADIAYDSKYHGDYPMCGTLWLTEDATRLVTRCTATFRTGAEQSSDIVYAGSFSGVGQIFGFSHSKETGKILLATDDSGSSSSNGYPIWDAKPADYLVQYSSTYLAKEKKLLLPWFTRSDGLSFGTSVDSVFFNSDGSGHAVVLKIDSQSNLVQDYLLALSR